MCAGSIYFIGVRPKVILDPFTGFWKSSFKVYLLNALSIGPPKANANPRFFRGKDTFNNSSRPLDPKVLPELLLEKRPQPILPSNF